MKKLSYLFLALLLPGLIFVFLKYAGSNQFDIPIYYEEGVKSAPTGCAVPSMVPYTLPDSLWDSLDGKRMIANVIAFSGSELMDATRITNAIKDELGSNDVMFMETSRVQVDSSTLSRWRRCVFFLEAPRQTVLFDHEGRIRGYYDLRSRDEVDRLRVELKILLKQY